MCCKKGVLKVLDFHRSAEKWSFTAREHKILLSFVLFFWQPEQGKQVQVGEFKLD